MFSVVLIRIIFFYTSKISIFQCSVFFQIVSHCSRGRGCRVWARRPSYLSFCPCFPGTLKHNQDHSTWAAQLILDRGEVWTKLGAPGMFQASPYLQVTSLCGPALVFSLSASADSTFLCFVARDNSSSEDLDILLLPSVNKNTLEGNKAFPYLLLPLAPVQEQNWGSRNCICVEVSHRNLITWPITSNRLCCNFRTDTCNGYTVDLFFFFFEQNLGRKKNQWCYASKYGVCHLPVSRAWEWNASISSRLIQLLKRCCKIFTS